MPGLAPELPGRHMNAAGFLGWAPSRAGVTGAEQSVFVTNPLSLRPRGTAADSCRIAFPGGFLLHNGLPNPGFSQVVRQYRQRWAASPLPIWLHLIPANGEETGALVRRAEELEGVSALEIGLNPAAGLETCREVLAAAEGEKPFLAALPLGADRAFLEAAARSAAGGLVLGAPRGELPRGGKLRSGRLYGPALFAQMIPALRQAKALGFPVLIAGAGIWSQEGAEACIQAGADAVQWDGALWLPRMPG